MHAKSGEIQIRSVIYLMALYQCQFSCFDNGVCLCKMMSLGEARRRVHGNYFCKSKIIQNKNFFKKYPETGVSVSVVKWMNRRGKKGRREEREDGLRTFKDS